MGLRIRKLSMYARRMKSWEEGFKEFVSVLCMDNVLEAYLVGSRARGDYLPYSDYDVVVIVRESSDPLEEAVRLRRLRKHSFPLDLIVLTPSQASDPIYDEMFRTAIKLCSKLSKDK